MSKILIVSVVGIAFARGAEKPKIEPSITVACYYFGKDHPGDLRKTEEKGADWSEWELVKAAKPR